MKKILLLTENFPPVDGGSSRWFWELYSRLDDFEIHILTHTANEKSLFQLKPHFKIHRTNLRSTEWGLKSIVGLKFYVRSILTVRKIVQEYNIDEIHCGRVIHEGVIAWVIKLFKGIQYRCFVHGEDVETANSSREQRLLVKQVCKHSKSLVCNSLNSAELVSKLGFEKKSKCKILNPGVDTNKFVPSEVDNEFKKSMGWNKRFVLLTVGRLQRRKGQDFLIKAIPNLIKTRDDLLLVIIGKGELEIELRELIKELNVGRYVQIHTNCKDSQMIMCYQQCDGFILPNRTIGEDIEGFGMVLVEAQACGKAVIAGDSGGTRETMLVGKTGFIIDCSSPESLSVQLSQLISPINSVEKNSTLLTDCQKNARPYVKANLDWNAHVAKAKKHFTEDI